MSAPSWKDRLSGEMSPEMTLEIDTFEGQIDLKKQGKLDDKFFAETRLRRGAYGQRYDNGQRHDGVETRELAFPSGELTKGPQTIWDAPGMQRIKIPLGKLSPKRLILNLGQVPYRDSSAIAVLVEALQKMRKAGGKVLLTDLQPRVKSLLEIARLGSIFVICKDEAEALTK